MSVANSFRFEIYTYKKALNKTTKSSYYVLWYDFTLVKETGYCHKYMISCYN